MKLNKFLVAAAAVAVLPLSVANAEDQPTHQNGPKDEPTLVQPTAPEFDASNVGTVNDVPKFKGGVNGTEAAVLDKPEFKGGVNAADAPVLDKPEYKLPNKGTFKVDKGTEAGKAQNGQKVLPKTSAVK